MRYKSISTKKKVDAKTMAQRIGKWNPNLKVELSAEGDSVIAFAKYLDVDADDLHSLSSIIGDEYKVTLGRSGANFRMIIW